MARLIVKVKTTAPRPQESDNTNTVVLMVGSTPQGDTGLKGDKGDKGDKGEQGAQGEQGIQGLKGDKGDKGDPFIYTDFTPPQLAALKGAKGDTGARGLKGDKGDKGDKGETGASGTNSWGSITGNIADQLDLTQRYYTKTEVDSKTQILFDGLISAGLNGGYYDITTAAYPNVNIAADGKLSRSTAIVATKDSAGNVAVASIQAGIGAPKIAYKKFVFPVATTTMAHGLNKDKILSIIGVYISADGNDRYLYTGAKVVGTALIAENNPTYIRQVLITYEVD